MRKKGWRRRPRSRQKAFQDHDLSVSSAATINGIGSLYSSHKGCATTLCVCAIFLGEAARVSPSVYTPINFSSSHGDSTPFLSFHMFPSQQHPQFSHNTSYRGSYRIPTIVARIHDHSSHGGKMPNDGHSNPTTEEAASEDVVSVQWERPQDQSHEDVHHEENGCDAKPLADVAEGFRRHGVDYVVKVQ